jgi:hypothetical protein
MDASPLLAQKLDATASSWPPPTAQSWQTRLPQRCRRQANGSLREASTSYTDRRCHIACAKFGIYNFLFPILVMFILLSLLRWGWWWFIYRKAWRLFRNIISFRPVSDVCAERAVVSTLFTKPQLTSVLLCTMTFSLDTNTACELRKQCSDRLIVIFTLVYLYQLRGQYMANDGHLCALSTCLSPSEDLSWT